MKVDSRVIPMQDMVLVLMWLVEETFVSWGATFFLRGVSIET